MFSYYGSKSKIASKYPAPRYKTIIEPFAGSARYSLLHHEGHNVILIDAYPVITGVWRWLKKATRKDFERLPIPRAGEAIPSIDPIEARWFLAFMSDQGVGAPRNVSGRMGFCKLPGGNWEAFIQRLPWIRNWKIIEGDYTAAPDIEATWYVDPPYSGQSGYKHNNVDYTALASWCQERKGQVCVCENDTARWLPFSPFCRAPGQRTTSSLHNECIYCQCEGPEKCSWRGGEQCQLIK